MEDGSGGPSRVRRTMSNNTAHYSPRAASSPASAASSSRPLRSPPSLPSVSPAYQRSAAATAKFSDRSGAEFVATSSHSPSTSLGSSSSENHELHEFSDMTLAAATCAGAANDNRRPAPLKDVDDVTLLSGERVEAVYKNITYLCPYSVPGSHKGALTITNYKLVFRSGSQLAKDGPFTVELPLGFVNRLEKVGGQRISGGENVYGIDITCKDVRSLRFSLNKSEGQPSRKSMFETLRIFSFPVSNNCPLFAFEFSEKYPDWCNGWRVYDELAEFKRQGLPNESWRISRINENYDFCETYPRYLAVPAIVTDDELREVAKYRSRNRLPVLSWMNPESTATICRSAQPLVGMRNNRSEPDERYVQQIMDANPHSHRIFIMDARPKVNALANVATGGGYENENFYECVELLFLDIHNIHVMRESLRKMKDICFPVIDDAKWLSNVDNTQWLHHLHCILTGAVKIADKVENGKTSVVVHCSDGWDRTSQLTALAMLLLDPFYRTLKGFQVLIEKEWLAFGHKFGHRIGHGEDKHNDNDRSPVFLQFIDCVWQITNQFPYDFEFNEFFLTFVLDHLYSCLFGTFLYNSSKERLQHDLKKSTHSLWSYVNYKREHFLNPTYNGGGQVAALLPVTTISYMKPWTGYYCRWNQRMRPEDSVRHRQTQGLAIKEQLVSKMESLKKELEGKKWSNSSSQHSFSTSDNHHGHHHNHHSVSSAVLTKYDPVNI